ncbi:MAG: glycosyltransferase family 1 protein [Vulcanimicrobiaceae bacterium]
MLKRGLQAALGTRRLRIARNIPAYVDAVWHPWNGIFFHGHGPHVATIADIAPFRFPAPERGLRLHQQEPFRDACARAHTILTISHSAKQDIISFLGADPERIVVTYLGVHPAFTPGSTADLPGALRGRPYFLFIGETSEERKNFQVLYDALQRAWPRKNGPVIAVLSRQDPRLEQAVHIRADREDVSAAANIRLCALYRGALATCVPALYEGFGMPAIESMACGTPVLASAASSLPEVCGDAAMLLDPADVRQWSSALQHAQDGDALRTEVSSKGLARARLFRWDTCADETLKAIRGAAAGYSIP